MSNFMNDEIPKHRKKRKKRKPKKSDHKHEYEIVEKEQLGFGDLWNYEQKCKICGKVYTELRIEKDD